MTYRPPGRSNRAGRAQADNDVFEGLPVKQWGQSITHVSLAPPKSETANADSDKWGEPPMPRDFQLLQPWTQQLLRLARSGRVGGKRKPDPDAMDDDKPDEDAGDESKANLEDRGFVAKKWKPVPESLLEPEHKHFEFLAKRRRGLPSLYGPEIQNGPVITMRKTKVQKTGADGEVSVYEVLVPEGQTVAGEVTEPAELADVTPVAAAPGTVIEGVGIVNEEGVVVAEHLRPPVAPRRNRPPPKKKGGPGRGKKRVTFTNPDGSTYTTIVPNATKIVPQPGQIVTHVAKGEEAKADITAEQAAAQHAAQKETDDGEDGEGDGDGDGDEGSDEEGEEGDEDDDREEGELSEDGASAGTTPVPSAKDVSDGVTPVAANDAASTVAVQTEDVTMTDAAQPVAITSTAPPTESVQETGREQSSSPDIPLGGPSHSPSNSQVGLPSMGPATIATDIIDMSESEKPIVEGPSAIETAEPITRDADEVERKVATFENGDEDLLGNLEMSLATDKQEDEAT